MIKTIRYRVVLCVYSLIWWTLLPILICAFCARLIARAPGYDSRRLSRFAIFSRRLKPSTVLWHCVSVGEVVAAVPLVKKVLAKHPQHNITITTTTPTGAAQVRHHFESELGNRVQHTYLPYDCGWLMRRLLNRIQPTLVLMTEVEIWPNLINACTVRKVPTAIVNARMTSRSARGYAKLGDFFRQTVRQLAFISCQSQADKKEYLNLGARPDSVVISGNIKFELSENKTDVGLKQLLDDWTANTQGIVVAAGSTHEPEEELLLEALRNISNNISSSTTLLCLAPRHPQRFDSVEAVLKSQHINYARLSQIDLIRSDTRVLLLDAMGLLHTVYQVADIAFIGGSFAPRGGHNALEPALYNTPIIMGPSQYNNPQIYQQLSDAGCLVTVDNPFALQRQLNEWVENSDKRKQAGSAGNHIIQQNKGALNANAALIATLL